MPQGGRRPQHHFRPIQHGFAMSGYPEADIGTAGIYEYTP
jgi:hypothetical protein